MYFVLHQDIMINMIKIGSSCSQIFFTIGFLKNLETFSGKHLHCRLFLVKLQTLKPATLLRRKSNTDFFIFLIILYF